MRTISATALATLSQPYGVEPVIIIQVFWTPTQVKWYSDKTLSSTIKGSILDMSAFDDVVNFDGNKATQSFSLTLDDVDQTIKAIYDVNDIHKCKVNVYQWFTGIPLDDMFLIFEGEINSPIVWREGDRTLAFSVVSQIEDQEVGFAPEEGLFDSIPDDLIGKPFPLIFGIVRLIPATKLDPIPTGILLDTVAAPDPSIDAQINALIRKIQRLSAAATDAFYMALLAYNSGVGTADTTPGNILGIDDHWNSIAEGFVSQGNGYLNEIWQAQQEIQNLVMTKTAQMDHRKQIIRIHNGSCFPQGQDSTVVLGGGTTVRGRMAGSNFQVSETVHPGTNSSAPTITQVPISETTGPAELITKLGMSWEPADQPFKLQSNLPVRYLCSMLATTVLNVWAYRNYNDTRVLMQVPSEYYSVSTISFGSMPVTMLTLARPLSYYDSKWDDSIFVDLQSSIGPNTVSIITWLIENYTTKAVDAASFAAVSARLSAVPSNFALLRQENIIRVLSDIAYQARCSLTLKNDIFYLQYLPDEPTPVDTITLDDILVNTLELNHTPTENLVTKLTAEWIPTYEGGRTHKIIIRNNTAKYGIQDQSVNWYIYTDPGFVDAAASFWAIRKSNTWKLIRFKTPLTKLKLESLDAVTINFASNWVCNTSVTGIIQSVKLNTKELNLEFEVWLPVRLGEMTKYNFAWPPDSDVAVNPGNLDFQKPGHDAVGTLTPTNGTTACGQQAPATLAVGKGAREKQTHPTPQTVATGVIVAPSMGGLDTSGRPNFPYTYSNTQFNATPDPSIGLSGSFPGRITENPDSPIYIVKTYLKGLQNPGSNLKVTDVTAAPKIAVGVWVTVVIVTWSASRDSRTSSIAQQKTAKYLIPTSGQSVFIGKIVSGTGDTYQVQLYTSGKDTVPLTPSTVTVKQLQIDASEQIPVNTWVIVVLGAKDNGDGTTTPEYTMQVPVYIGD